MMFWKSKCASLAIEKKRKNLESHETIVMNGITIKSLEEGNSNIYLGQDENI